MTKDATYQRCVAALWALIGATRAGDEQQVEAAAQAAVAALAAARDGDSYLMVHEVDGAIHVSGRQLRLGVDVFASAQGMAAVMRSRAIGEVLFDAAVAVGDLVAWGRCWATSAATALDPDAELGLHGVAGIHASRRHAAVEPVLQLQRREAAGDDPDSRLRSVFLQHQLIGAIVADGVVPPTVAKAVLQAVVERLLGVPRGLEPLMLLQQDEALLRRSLHVAVLAVAFARVAGWPQAQLADIGAAALLHDLGALLEPSRPAAAAFRWLLERGTDDFWLRCAIVARTWRDARGETIAELSAAGTGLGALVRLAAVVAGPPPAAGLAQCGLPGELVELAGVALQGLRC